MIDILNQIVHLLRSIADLYRRSVDAQEKVLVAEQRQAVALEQIAVHMPQAIKVLQAYGLAAHRLDKQMVNAQAAAQSNVTVNINTKELAEDIAQAVSPAIVDCTQPVHTSVQGVYSGIDASQASIPRAPTTKREWVTEWLKSWKEQHGDLGSVSSRQLAQFIMTDDSYPFDQVTHTYVNRLRNKLEDAQK